MTRLQILILPCLIVISYSQNTAVQSGQQEYEVIKRHSNMPKYGQCWTNSLKHLENGCKNLNDELQSRLALNFANCFLAQAGQRTYPCNDKENLAVCLRSMDSNAFAAYSNFFTHTHNMCQFLQQQVWHTETENAIQDLTKTSSQVAESLENSSKLQQDIMSNQLETLSYQKEMAEHGSLLSQSMEQSREHVKELMKELRASTDEQKSMIFSIFDRVTKLQSMLLSEVSWLYTILFYGACLLFIYIATSSKRTEDARLWLILIMSLNAFLERFLCDYTLDSNENIYESDILMNDENSVQALLHHRIWFARKCSILMSFLVLAFKAFTFQDYNRINFQLLQDIKKQNSELSFAFKMMKEGRISEGKDVLDQVEVKDYVGEDGDDERSDVEEDDLSYISTQTDMTWQHMDKYSSDEDDGDLTDVVEEPNDEVESTKTTPTNNNKDKITELLSSIEPDRKKRGRTPGSRNSSRCTTPTLGHSYNLRTRKQNQSFSTFDSKESEDEFGKLISRTAKNHRRQRKDILESLKLSKSLMHAISETDE